MYNSFNLISQKDRFRTIEGGHLSEPRGQSKLSVRRSRIARAFVPASGEFPLVLRTAGLAFSVNNFPFVLVTLAILCSETALTLLILGGPSL